MQLFEITRRPLFFLLVGAGALLALSGCEPASGVLLGPGDGGDDDDIVGDDDDDDTGFGIADDVPDAELFQPFEHRMSATGYGGPARWALVGGALPAGISLATDGTLSGEAEELGGFTFEVEVTETSVGDITGSASMTVGVAAEDLSLGYDHEFDNNMTEKYGLMGDIWLRLSGGGLDYESEAVLTVAVFHVGENGEAEGGRGDDIYVEDLDISELEATIDSWAPTDQALDNDPPTYEGGGRFLAGSDAGNAVVTLSHAEYGDLETNLLIVTPDWCPKGQSSGPGQGACN